MKHLRDLQFDDTINAERVPHKKKNYYKFPPIFFDTETSHIQNANGTKDSWVYLFAFSYGDSVYYGRNIVDFFDTLNKLIDYHGIDKEHSIDIYCHNLSYDYSYISYLIADYFGIDNDHTIFDAPHRPITIVTERGINFKCTYRLSMRSLDKWGADLGITNRKKTGTKDYTAVYYPDDNLPVNEYLYMEYDILSLKECYYKEIEINGYTYLTAPLTATGKVRDIFKDKYKNNPDKMARNLDRAKYQCGRVTLEQYNQLLDCAMGGMTEGNYSILGQRVDAPEGIGHSDFDSHYITQMVCFKYPIRPYNRTTCINKFSDIVRHCNNRDSTACITAELIDVKLKPNIYAPFLCMSKVKYTDTTRNLKAVNGKIYKCDGSIVFAGWLLDFETLREQYNFKIKVLKVTFYTLDYLPSYITDTVKELYKEKTRLKNLENHYKDIGELEKAQETHTDLMNKKALLNSVFGCCYTRIIRDKLLWNAEQYDIAEQNDEEILNKYYDNYDNCIQFFYGTYTTALARRELWKLIQLCNVTDECGKIKSNFLYCDTDSIFYIYDERIEKAFAEYNAKCLEDSKKRELYVDYTDYDGTEKRKYFHKFDFEHDHRKYIHFKVLHAKCYALSDDNGGLTCTIAGVTATNGKTGADKVTREQELQNIDNLTNKFIFYECGGTRIDYSNIHPFDGFTQGGAIIENVNKTLKDLNNDEDLIILIENC